jgi:hypothetical protein
MARVKIARYPKVQRGARSIFRNYKAPFFVPGQVVARLFRPIRHGNAGRCAPAGEKALGRVLQKGLLDGL